MEKKMRWLSALNRILSYILVAAIASGATFFVCLGQPIGISKLDQLQQVIRTYFIEDADMTAVEDAAAAAMVDALGDRWSYYISAEDYAAYHEQMTNTYVGIGITVAARSDGSGLDITKVEPGGGAQEAGVLAGDILVEAAGKSVAELGTTAIRDMIRGEEGTQVSIGVLRGNEKLTFSVTRKTIQVAVAQGQLLDQAVGLVTIRNYDDRCADETIAAVKALIDQGAKSLIFDVRNNPGGYKHELVNLLDYLLPEGTVFRSVDYAGNEETESSDESCLEMPMAVLVNGNSYSAAEFFAAALSEYDWATVVGEQTCGKGYFQNTFRLRDGSAVGLSIGKYFTPKGVNLAQQGGLIPQVSVPVDEKTAAAISSGTLTPNEDPQIQAAITILAAP